LRLFSEKKSRTATTPRITAAATDTAGRRLTDEMPDRGAEVGAADVGAGVAILYDPVDGLGTEGVTL